MLCFLYRLLTLLVFNSERRVRRSVWCKERSTDWWSGVVSGLYGESWWQEIFERLMILS